MREIVKIVPSELRQKVESGWKLDQLAQHYGLSKASMRNALKQLGLKIRALRAPAFTFVEEEVHDAPAQHITPDEVARPQVNLEEIANNPVESVPGNFSNSEDVTSEQSW